MFDKSELLNQQLEQAGKDPSKTKGVPVPKGDGVFYLAELRRLIRAIQKDINETIMPTVRNLEPQYTGDSATMDSWVDVITASFNSVIAKYSVNPSFQSFAARLAAQFVGGVNNRTREAFNKDMKRVGLDVYGESPELQDYISASVYDNTRLIKSIPEQYLNNVQSIVMSNVRAGMRPSAIQKELAKQFGVTDRRAKLIARDQTSKLNGDLTERRQKNVGFEYFQWVDSDDSRVRTSHEEIANKVTAYGLGVYRWDDLPMNERGERIKPGSDYQCRCFARPVSQEEVDENRRAGRTNPSVKR